MTRFATRLFERLLLRVKPVDEWERVTSYTRCKNGAA